MDHNISLSDYTNFLKNGACIRWQDHWYLFWEKEINSIESITPITTPIDPIYPIYPIDFDSVQETLIECDFLTSQISYYRFKRCCALSVEQLEKLIDDWNLKFLEENQTDMNLKRHSNTHSNKYSNKHLDIHWEVFFEKAFKESFENVHSAILDGRIEKAVPFYTHYGRLLNPTAISEQQKNFFMKKSLHAHPELIPYGQWQELEGFFGLTPELFCHYKDSKITTMALAGTCSLDTPSEVFLADQKERKEHQIVVKDISEKLANLGELFVDETKAVEFPSLKHLRTKIQVTLDPSLKSGDRDVNLAEIIKRLHPTPALGIYPSNDYWDEFKSLSFQKNRGSFGAPWGFQLRDELVLVIAIRRMEWNKNVIKIPAGCGIVAESYFEKEFAEINKKINSVKNIFYN